MLFIGVPVFILFVALAFLVWRFVLLMRTKSHMTEEEIVQKKCDRAIAKREQRNEKIRKIEKELLSREEGLRKKRALFLRKHAALENAPAKMEISKIIQEVDVPTKFKLGFWAAKQKVCKPFAS